jgi:hypothetical protein
MQVLLPSQYNFIHFDNHRRSNAINKYLFQLKNDFNEELFLQSIKHILDRHLSLKSIFFQVEGEFKFILPESSQIEKEIFQKRNFDLPNLKTRKKKENIRIW